jgi:excisionase family DNA binding protein
MPKAEKPAIPLPKLFTVDQIATHLQCSTKPVRRWIKSGKLTAKKFGRHWGIAENDLALFLSIFNAG